MFASNSPNCPVVIAHAEPVVAVGLKAMLEEANFPEKIIIIDAESVAGLVVQGPHLLVADFDTAIRIRRLGRSGRTLTSLKLIVVCVRHTYSDCQAAWESGADGLLLSGFKSSEFVDAVDVVLRGAEYRCSGARLLMSEHDSRDDLTLREAEVASYLAGGHAYKEIASELGIAMSTVKAHIKSIFSKFRVRNRVQASCVAAERGIVPKQRPQCSEKSSAHHLSDPIHLGRSNHSDQLQTRRDAARAVAKLVWAQSSGG